MFSRKSYVGPVLFGPDGWHYTDTKRRKKLVSIDGLWFRARRSDPSHQSRYHRRYAEVTP